MQPGRTVPASGVAVFGPLQFQAGRACYACALGRPYFGRAAAPRALGRGRGSCRPPGPCPPSLGLLCPPGACARSSRGRWSWSASAWAAGPSAAARGQPAPDHLERPRPVAGAAPPGLPPAAARPALPRPAPGRGAPEGRRGAASVRPPRFPPRIGAGFSPVTRAAGDSPAHNARPRRSPRNARSINHSDMKSTNFMQVRLHKT